ncbi:DUF1611 domain-containing protein [Planosporangium sp. 12N6]|uniref:DUF1611 domain-containing protein n=1 Tax=Planosporangium spinosum TaxID=3402278 RepID=UPI003CEF55E0
MRHLKRLAVLADDEILPAPSKTLTALLRYRRDHVVTVIDRNTAGRDTGDVPGLALGAGIPVVSDVAASLAYQPDALLLADEPVGAGLQPYWREQVLIALEAGLDIVNGFHHILSDDLELVAAASQTGARIWDLREQPRERYLTEFSADGRPIVAFRPHRPGSRTVLAVGTDCGSGKMTTMLELQRAARARGLDSSFVATGQVGMMVSGEGIAVDGIVADFVNGIVEDVVFHQAQSHDLVLVEGQGALNHPRYSAVTLGLLHGCRPDSMVLCHVLGRDTVSLLSHVALPSVSRAVEINEQATRWTVPDQRCPVVGISVVTRSVSDADARAALARIEEDTGLPTTDVLRYGPARLLDAVLAGPAAGEVWA